MLIYKPAKLKWGECMILFILLYSFFILISCSQKNPSKTDVVNKKDTFQPPSIYKNKSETVTLLDTCPKLRVIDVPQKPGGSYTIKTSNGAKTIHLSPPVTKPADFYVTMQHYNVEDGLPLSDVEVSYRDRNGNLWFGTYGGGVSRYDGKSFTNFSLAHGQQDDQLFSIYQDRNGNMWFGTYNGLVKYDGRSFKTYRYADTLVAQFKCITQDKNGNIWFGTGYGLWKYTGKSFQSYFEKDGLPGNDINCILCDKNENIWLGTDTGISRYDGKTFKNYTIAQGLADNYVTSLLQDKNGNIWIGTGNGICEFNGNGFKNFTTAQGLVNNVVTSLLQDENGHLWIGTLGGASEYDGDSFRNYTVLNGLAGNQIESMVEDKSEDIWFTTAHDGVCRYSGNGFVSYKKAQGLSDDMVTAICQQSNGILWFGTGGSGAVRYDGKTFTNFALQQGLAANSIFDIYEDLHKNLWFATYRGVVCYNGKSFTNYTISQGLGADVVWSIAGDKKGNLWFATFGGGVSKLSRDRKTFTSYVAPDTVASSNVHAVFEDLKGNVWFGYDEGGATVYNGKSFKNYRQKQGLTDLYVGKILEDKNNNLWFATFQGMFRYDGKSFMNFTADDGLPDDDIYDIVEDKNGTLWFGSRLGFSGLKFKAIKPGENDANGDVKFSNDILKTNYKPIFENYNFKNGYPVRDMAYLHSMYIDANNILWAGTGDKLVRFDHGAIHKNNNPPNVFIQDIKIHNEIIPWYDLITQKEKPGDSIKPANTIEEENLFGKALKEDQINTLRKNYGAVKFDSITPFYAVPVNLVLPYNDNDMTFDFAAIETSRPNLIRYQYMLDGYDKDWRPVTDKATATFGNMHEGDYTFKLKAQSPDGIWSKTIIYTFKVLPPWYRSWWAYTLYVLAFIIALWGFTRWRVSVLKKEKLLLEEKVTIRTNELKKEKEKVESTLSELKSTQAQLIQSEKMASLGELTAGIAHEIQNPLNFVNNFSEVNGELIDDLVEEVGKGNYDEVKVIAVNLKDNEEKIIHHGKRADAIVKGMLQHSKISTGFKEPTDINKLADEYLRLAYHGMRAKDKSFNAEIKTDFDESVGKISVVQQDIGRVLLNLYNNAFYAVNERCKAEGVGLKAESKPYVPIVTIVTKKPGDKIEIKVEDNGTGIPQNIIDKIFQPFFTTKPTGQGTGLGLSLSYDIIKAHGGEIKVETKEGEGSEFIIQLATNKE